MPTASGQRVSAQRSEPPKPTLLLRQAARATGARRLLLVLGDAATLHTEASLLPRGDDAAALLQAITPWLAAARATRKPRLRHGPDGAARAAQRSCIVAPLVVQRRVLGFLYADIDGAFGRFDATHRDVLAALATQAASALASAQEAEALNAELVTINGIQQGIASKLDFDEIVELVGDRLSAATGLRDISIRWFDRTERTVRGLYSIEHGRRLDNSAAVAFRPGGSTERLFETGQPIVTRTAIKEAATWGTVPGTDGALCSAFVPIIGASQVLGGLMVDDHEREHAFGEPQLRMLSTVAAAMGTALENARLFDETQRLLKETERRSAYRPR